jgi:hypothetical protein
MSRLTEQLGRLFPPSDPIPVKFFTRQEVVEAFEGSLAHNSHFWKYARQWHKGMKWQTSEPDCVENALFPETPFWNEVRSYWKTIDGKIIKYPEIKKLFAEDVFEEHYVLEVQLLTRNHESWHEGKFTDAAWKQFHRLSETYLAKAHNKSPITTMISKIQSRIFSFGERS